ncbi:UDP-2,3-diacylglucosamine diphosphatase [Shewanella algae]|uniref:UDP-2,3-diacylglucosamine diphosphatase n=1 Tax=Shewanella algae TaxID=38313 RepID=UPI001AADDADD|nr:UDP-2,3-diacylglucosamine diphosphatase [Shewanella algae]MBO2603081.1 UDP-2,3-diacylglucosamine diphosphatase [Shewanella algae]
MRTLFIGDLHLSADRQDILNAFYQFLDTGLEQVDALYILGDLFEVWVSDDLAEPFALALAERLYEVSRTLPVYFIHGNRDFMLGKEYAVKAGITLLPEVYRLDLYGHKTVLLHGDSLCTLDKAYQRFRRFRNMALPRWIYRHLPKKTRSNIAAKLRQNSQMQNQLKSIEIMDVEPSAVDELFAGTGAELMIHGHTHRPDIHQLAGNKQRLVVGDWYEQGSVLSISADNIELTSLPFIEKSQQTGL